MNPKQSGIALLTVLLFLQILAILGMYALENSILANKIAGHTFRQNTQLTKTEQVMELVQNSLTESLPTCVIPMMSSVEIMAKSMTWWASSLTCKGSLDGMTYYYVVELLEEHVCAIVDQNQIEKGKKATINYSRITLLTISKNNDIRQLLQSTITNIDNPTTDCQGPIQITLGQQTWQELR